MWIRKCLVDHVLTGYPTIVLLIDLDIKRGYMPDNVLQNDSVLGILQEIL